MLKKVIMLYINILNSIFFLFYVINIHNLHIMIFHAIICKRKLANSIHYLYVNKRKMQL